MKIEVNPGVPVTPPPTFTLTLSLDEMRAVTLAFGHTAHRLFAEAGISVNNFRLYSDLYQALADVNAAKGLLCSSPSKTSCSPSRT